MILLAPSFVRALAFAIFMYLLPCVRSQGLTLDACRSDQDCVSPRRCSTESQLPCDGSSTCSCFPDILEECISDDDCSEGEACVAPLGSQAMSPFCVSKAVAASSTSLVPVTQPNPTEGGVTLELCLRNSDCLAPRICIVAPAAPSSRLCLGQGEPCVCFPPVLQECQSDADCLEREGCGLEGRPVCVMENLASGVSTNSPNPAAIVDPDVVANAVGNGGSTEAICVAERHMKGVNGIYDSGRLARVLCDSHGSCATPGHMVVFRGSGMMMRSYCAISGCTESVMKVNSPKWERRLRLQSWSDGLEFTAFAARYTTMAEEMVLAGAVRAGL